MNKKELLKKYGLEKPFPSWRKEKKKAVLVRNPETGKIKIIHYGAKGYEDYTQHKDKKRRENFRKRMGCDPVSKLNKLKAKFWACTDLW